MPGRAIREVSFRGTHYERGLQRGERLRETLVLPEDAALPRWFVDGCEEAAAELYPAVLEEFAGLVEGGGFDRKKARAYYFARLESRLGGCTMFAVGESRRAGGRGPLVGRNYDWATADLRWCELHRCNPAEGLRRIGYTHHWAGCPDVLNEAGLYLAIASLPAEPVRAPGAQWSILVECIAETCRTVSEAVDVCAGARHLRPMSYLLADPEEAAVVEATPSAVRVRRPQEGMVCAANVALGGDTVAEYAADEDAPAFGPRPPTTEHSVRAARARVARATEMLAAASPRVASEDTRRILSDHEARICTGDHARADGGEWATIWSGICAPAEDHFRIALGLPCRSEYRPFGVA